MNAADTRTAILDLAEELLQSRSFNSFSYQDIADAVGIRKASVHYHFPGKEDLGVALVERSRRRAHDWASRLVEENSPPAEKLQAYFEIQTDILREGGKICVQGILGAEFNALPARVRDSYMDFLEEHLVWLTKVLEKGQQAGVFADDTPAAELAALIQSAIQGSLQMARASGRPERFHAVVDELRRRVLKPPTATPESPVASAA